MEPNNQIQQKSNGALVGSIIIIVILIIGGIYLWKTSLKENTMPTNSLDETANLEADANSIELESLDEGI